MVFTNGSALLYTKFDHSYESISTKLLLLMFAYLVNFFTFLDDIEQDDHKSMNSMANHTTIEYDGKTKQKLQFNLDIATRRRVTLNSFILFIR